MWVGSAARVLRRFWGGNRCGLFALVSGRVQIGGYLGCSRCMVFGQAQFDVVSAQHIQCRRFVVKWNLSLFTSGWSPVSVPIRAAVDFVAQLRTVGMICSCNRSNGLSEL